MDYKVNDIVWVTNYNRSEPSLCVIKEIDRERDYPYKMRELSRWDYIGQDFTCGTFFYTDASYISRKAELKSITECYE